MFEKVKKWGLTKMISGVRNLFTKNPPHSYTPTFFLRHHILQSLYELASPQIDINFLRERVYFMDGGHISLDWVGKEKAESGAPIVLIMHGMTGGSQTKYIKVLVQRASEQGFCCVCINSRGINSEMTSPIPFVGFQFHQLNSALKRITTFFPKNNLYFIGTSLGGNYILRYILKEKKTEYTQNIKCMALISPPFDVNYVIDGMNAHYQKFFIKSYLKYSVLRHQHMKFWWESGLINLQQLKKSKTLKEFHDRITIKIMGFSSSEELFNHFKINADQIENLTIPTLILASKDDPMVGFPSFPIEALQKNQNIQLHFTKSGGHLCWFQGVFPPKRWYPKPVFNFFLEAAHKNMQKLMTEKNSDNKSKENK